MKSLISGVLALSVLTACGSDPVVVPTPPPPPVVPAVNVTATGAGLLVVHPSVNRIYAVALATPIRITETAGGSADWNFARMAIFLNGREIERSELGANAIQAAGFGRVAANSNQVNRIIFRFNSDDFDRIDITLGFTDVKDGRTFTVAVPLESFAGVDVDFNAVSLQRSPIPL